MGQWYTPRTVRSVNVYVPCTAPGGYSPTAGCKIFCIRYKVEKLNSEQKVLYEPLKVHFGTPRNDSEGVYILFL